MKKKYNVSIGDKINDWTVLRQIDGALKRQGKIYEVQCKCGSIKRKVIKVLVMTD